MVWKWKWWKINNTGHYLPKEYLKDYNVKIDGKNFFDQPVKSSIKAYESVRKIATGQGDDYTTVFLVDYNSFKNYYNIYNMIVIDLTKQQALDADPKAIQ